LALWVLTATKKNRDSFSPILTKSLAFVSVVLLILLGLSFWKKGFGYFPAMDFSQNLIQKKEAAILSNHVFWQAAIYLIILFTVVVLVRKNKLKSSSLFAAVILEMFIAVQLNMPYTGKSFEGSPRQITQEILLNQAARKPIDLTPIAEQTDHRASFSPLWRNTSTFQHRISADGYNSFMLNGFKDLLTQHRPLLDSMNQNGIAYLSDDVRPLSSLNNTNIARSTVFLPDSLTDKLPPLKNDSANTISIYSEGFCTFVVQAKISAPILLTLQQNYYPGWKACANGKEIPLMTGNLSCLSVLLTPEITEVTFRYENPAMIKAAIFSLIGFLLILFGYVSLSLKEKLVGTKEFHSGILLCGLYLYGTLLFTGKPHPTSRENKLHTRSLQAEKPTEEIEPDGFSSVLDIDLDALPRKGFVIETRFTYLDSLQNKAFFYVVTHQNDAGESVFYRSYSANYYMTYGKTEENLTIKTPYYPLQKQGKMRIYFWNAGKTRAAVRNAETTVYR
jgi:hypothetical protein